MRDDRKIVCPDCGETLGKYVLHNVTMTKLGAIPAYDSQIDYTKAAHIGVGRGALCRKCANKYFPDGVAYKVVLWYVHGWINASCGINRTPYFATRDKAEEAVADLNKRCADNRARVEVVEY